MSLVNKAKLATGAAALALASFFTLSPTGQQAIVKHEGYVPTAYQDSVGVWTICSGSTFGVRAGMVATPAQCAERLKVDTSTAGRAVSRLVKVPISQRQYDALVSWTLNLGEGNLAKSTMLKRINAGQCYAAADEMLKWVYAGGKRLKGLETRRAEERFMFIGDCNLW